MVAVYNHGSIVLVSPDNEGEEEWLRDETGADAIWWPMPEASGGRALVVEPRYVEPLLQAMFGEED